MDEIAEKAEELTEKAESRLTQTVRGLKPYLTFSVALVTAVVAGIVIFIVEYLMRYGSWDGFYWQKKAWTKLIVFCFIEAVAFLLLKFC